MLQTKIEVQELAIADNEEIERNEKPIKKLRDIATENAEMIITARVNGVHYYLIVST